MSINSRFYVKDIKGNFVPAEFLRDSKGNYVINPNASHTYSDSAVKSLHVVRDRPTLSMFQRIIIPQKIENPMNYLIAPKGKGDASTLYQM